MPQIDPNTGLVTYHELLRVLSYSQDTGIFTWKVALSHRNKIGDIAGCVHLRGAGKYCIAFRMYYKLYLAHRLAWFYVYGEWPTRQIDHINGDSLDNRIANLREATNAQNMQNLHSPHSDNKSGLLGVSWHGASNKWRARICIGGVSRELGLFADKHEAHSAYLRAKKSLHPFGEISRGEHAAD